MADFLLLDGEKRVPTKRVDSVEALKPLLNESAWQIVKLLRRQESYPAEIAKKLGLNEQTVYYYVKQLKASGLIEVSRTEEKQGALAKFFRCNYDSFSLVASAENARKAEFTSSPGTAKQLEPALKEFLEPFITEGGRFDAKIVVGSPDPHGELKARARDGHLAVELAAFLGSLCNEINYPLIYLDTQIPSIEKENSNLILLGGPIRGVFLLRVLLRVGDVLSNLRPERHQLVVQLLLHLLVGEVPTSQEQLLEAQLDMLPPEKDDGVDEQVLLAVRALHPVDERLSRGSVAFGVQTERTLGEEARVHHAVLAR